MLPIEAIRHRLKKGLPVVVNDVEVKLTCCQSDVGIHVENANICDIMSAIHTSKLMGFKTIFIDNFAEHTCDSEV